MTGLYIVIGILTIVGIIVLAKSADKEARRITTEVEFRLDGVNALCESIKYDGSKAEQLERKAARLKARANEVASRQPAGWRLFAKATRKARR